MKTKRTMNGQNNPNGINRTRQTMNGNGKISAIQNGRPHPPEAKEEPVLISAEEAIDIFRRGEPLILVDDEDRENEGDLVVAAEHVTPEIINFMTLHARGLVCVALTRERAEQLQLTPMVGQNTALLGTAFTVTVDAVEGTTTGISAHDRAVTVKKLIDPEATPKDFARPGHMFPLIAEDGGVLVRPGHTEAVVDLARAAGLVPAGVLCEILDDDGSMARLPRLKQLARKYGLKIASVGDLIRYRCRTEMLAERMTDVHLPTKYGDFRLLLYKNRVNPAEHHLALVKGDVSGDEPVLVRIHSECFTGDVLSSLRCDCGNQLHDALRRIETAGKGVVLYLRQEGRGIGLENKLLAYALQDQGKDTVEANQALGFKPDLREYWFAAQMLRDLGIRRVQLITNNPHKIQELEQYGIKVEQRVPSVVPPNPINADYLKTKREKLGHLIDW